MKRSCNANQAENQNLNAAAGKRRRGRSAHRRRLLDIFSSGWKHVGEEDATDAVVQAVTQGPGSAGAGVRRMLLQTTATTGDAATNPTAGELPCAICNIKLSANQPVSICVIIWRGGCYK